MTERIALVTGGASGIGRACVETLLRSGWRVFVLDRQTPDVGEWVACDVRDARRLAEQFRAIPRLDLAVNAAAVLGLREGPVETLATNFLGLHHCMKLELQRGARVINVSSRLSDQAPWHVPAYSMSKLAVNCLRGGQLVRPGMAATSMTAQWRGSLDGVPSAEIVARGILDGLLSPDGCCRINERRPATAATPRPG